MRRRNYIIGSCLSGLLAFMSPVVVGSEAAVATDQTHPSWSEVQQIRIYEIHGPNELAFHARFREHTLRIMKRHGFDVRAAWRSVDEQGTVRFIYLLNWPDRARIGPAWNAFLADAEWQRVKSETGAKHGRFVNSIADHVLEPIGLALAGAPT